MILELIMDDHLAKKVNLYEHELVHVKYYKLRTALELGKWDEALELGEKLLSKHKKYVDTNLAEIGDIYLDVAFAKQKLGMEASWDEVAKQIDPQTNLLLDALILVENQKSDEAWDVIEKVPFKRSHPPMSRLVIDLIFEYALVDVEKAQSLISRFEYLYLGETKIGFQAVAEQIRNSFSDCPEVWDYVRNQPKRGFQDVELKLFDLAKGYYTERKDFKAAASLLEQLLCDGVFGVRYVVGFMEEIGQTWSNVIIDRLIAGDPDFEPYWKLRTSKNMKLKKLRAHHKLKPKSWKKMLLRTPLHFPIPDAFDEALAKLRGDANEQSTVDLLLRFLQDAAPLRMNGEAGADANNNLSSALNDLASNFNRFLDSGNRFLDSGRNRLAGIADTMADTIVPSRQERAGEERPAENRSIFNISRARNVLTDALNSIRHQNQTQEENSSPEENTSSERPDEPSEPLNRNLVGALNNFLSGIRNTVNRNQRSRNASSNNSTTSDSDVDSINPD